MDKKALLAQDRWDPSIEQETFGDQHPYASATPPGPGPNFGPSTSTPSNPRPFPYIPEDAPPMYSSKDPVKNASAPLPRNPQEHVSPPYRNPQEGTHYPQGYQPVPQEIDPYVPPPQHPYNPHQSTPPLSPLSPLPPINYGATNNALHSANSSVAPKRRRLKRPKRSSGCYRCCCALLLVIILMSWFLKDIWIDIDGNCNLPERAESDTSSYVLPANKTLDLSYTVVDGIVGNIVIREAADWDIPDCVLVHRTWRTSSAKLSDAITDYISLDELKLTAELRIELNFNSTEERKQALRGNCARVDVEIVYPREMPGTGRLKVQVTNGDIQAVFDKVPGISPPTFETLILETTNGEIQLENVQVIGNTKLGAANGHVYGSLTTVGAVEASLLNGPIDLAINTGILPGVEKWNPEELDVDLETLNGPVTLEIHPSFQGHFEIVAAVGRTSITSSDKIHYKTSTSNKQIGWVSADGTEPTGRLPRMRLATVNGNIRAKIDA